MSTNASRLHFDVHIKIIKMVNSSNKLELLVPYLRHLRERERERERETQGES